MYLRRAKMKCCTQWPLAVYAKNNAPATAKNLALESSCFEKVHITTREIDQAVQSFRAHDCRNECCVWFFGERVLFE